MKSHVRLFKAAMLPSTTCFEEGQGGFVTVYPFLTDFLAEAMDGAGSDNGDAPALGAIGSMQGIVGIL
jgi:hypothetical protein